VYAKGITSLGITKQERMEIVMNKQIKEFCETHHITEAQFRGEEIIDDNIYWNDTILPNGCKIRARGDVDLSLLKKLHNNIVSNGNVCLDSLIELHGDIVANGCVDLGLLTELYNDIIAVNYIDIGSLKKLHGNITTGCCVLDESLKQNKNKIIKYQPELVRSIVAEKFRELGFVLDRKGWK